NTSDALFKGLNSPDDGSIWTRISPEVSFSARLMASITSCSSSWVNNCSTLEDFIFLMFNSAKYSLEKMKKLLGIKEQLYDLTFFIVEIEVYLNGLVCSSFCIEIRLAFKIKDSS